MEGSADMVKGLATELNAACGRKCAGVGYKARRKAMKFGDG